MSTENRINDSSGEADVAPALKLPCYCMDDFRNKGRCSKLSGRQEVLEAVDKFLRPSGKHTAPTGSASSVDSKLKVVALHGLEGIGKTQVAYEYALRKQHDFQVIAWIDASTRESTYASYRLFAKQIGLIKETGSLIEDEIIKNAVHKWLSNPRDGDSMVSWLLVLDSANDRDVVSDVWPHGGEGCVLLTTRHPAIVGAFATSEIEVLPLSSEDAAEMLLNLSGKRTEPEAKEHAEQIAKAWEGVPGCMELVDIVLRNKSMSLAEFAAIQNNEREGYASEGAVYNVKRSSGAFVILSGLAIENLEAQHESELDLLLALSFLDGSHVKEEILREHPSVATLKTFPKDASAYEKCKEYLWETSMIKYDGDLAELRVRTVVQDTLLSRMKAAGKELSDGFITANALVLSVWPCSITVDVNFLKINMSKRWVQCEKLAPHVHRLWSIYLELDRTEQQKCATRSFACLLAEAAWFQSEKANAAACLHLVDHGFAVHKGAERKEQDSMLDVLSALHNIKGAYFSRVNKPKEAAYHMGQYAEVQKQIQAISGGKPSAKLAAAYSELALARLECGEFEDVISLLRQSSAMRKELKDFTPVSLYNPLRYEGLYHMQVRNWAEAKRCFDTALEDRQKEFGRDDTKGPRAGVLLSHLGDLFCQQHHWAYGHAYHNRAYQSLKVALGEGHLSTLRAQYKLARDLFVINKPGNLALAKDLLEQCSMHYDRQVHTEGEKARLTFLLSRVLVLMGDRNALDNLANASQMLDALIQGENSRGAKPLTFADFDKVVPFGAR